MPAIALLAAAPLHISWFTSSLRGQIKRARQARAAAAAALHAETAPPLSPFLLPARAHLLSASSYFTAHLPSLSLPSPTRPSLSAFRPLSFRPTAQSLRHPFARDVREFFAANSRDENDVLRVVGATPGAMRMRAGQRGEDLKRFGGRIRRRVVGGLQAAF